MGEAPDALQQVMVPLIGRDVCNQDDWYGGNITMGMVCAGYEEGGRGSCHVSLCSSNSDHIGCVPVPTF